jgi:plasmid stabilization system protein ParE
MQEYRIVLTWEAIYDVTDITEYIDEEFGLERANQFQSDIRDELEKLEYLGAAFCKTQLYYRNYSIYLRIFSPSIIFYIIKNQEKEIHILRVLREERNWKYILAHTQNYTY